MVILERISWGFKKIMERFKQFQTKDREKNLWRLKASQENSICGKEILAKVRQAVNKKVARSGESFIRFPRLMLIDTFDKTSYEVLHFIITSYTKDINCLKVK